MAFLVSLCSIVVCEEGSKLLDIIKQALCKNTHFTERLSACRKRDIISSEPFRKISALCLPFLIALTTEEEIGPRSGRAGPSFSVRPEKEAKGAVLHGTSAAAKLSHDPTRSAGRTKTRRLTALKQFVRPFFHRAKRGEKIPS
ncbi:MAG: hypothetical protein KIC46_05480, partial [Clostridiales bacterium]|nr:hypothetical protein [Clostridiales bacterium]